MIATRDTTRQCRRCGCTDYHCEPCIAKTGAPCWWVTDDLCSACLTDQEWKDYWTKGTTPCRPTPTP